MTNASFRLFFMSCYRQIRVVKKKFSWCWISFDTVMPKLSLRKWKKQSTWGAHGGLNRTKHCSNVWLYCIDSNASGTARPPNRERKRPPEAWTTMFTSTSTTQCQDQQIRVNHLRDRILTATETSRQTIGRHGWIHTCMGRNYTTQQYTSCCFQPQLERQSGVAKSIFRVVRVVHSLLRTRNLFQLTCPWTSEKIWSQNV